jgi:hypothetical protein
MRTYYIFLTFIIFSCGDINPPSNDLTIPLQVSNKNDSICMFIFHDSIKINYNRNTGAFINDSLSDRTLKTINKKSVEALVELIDDSSESRFLTKCGFCNMGQITIMVLDISGKIPHDILVDRFFDEFIGGCQVGYLEYLKEDRKKIKKRAKEYCKHHQIM